MNPSGSRTRPVFRRRGPAGRVPLTEYHRPLWAAVKSGELGTYFTNSTNFVVRIHRPISAHTILESLRTLAARHRILTAHVMDSAGNPEFVFDQSLHVPLETLDASGHSGEARVEHARRVASEWIWKPFNLSQGPWAKSILIKISDADYVFGFVMHHMISDAASIDIARTELLHAYAAFAQGRQPSFPTEPLQYADWIAAMNEWIRSPAAEEHAEYWRRTLREAPATRVPPDNELELDEQAEVMFHSFGIPGEVVVALRRMNQQKRRLLHATVASALVAAVASFGGYRDMVVLTQVSGRRDMSVMGTIGALFDAVALRVSVDLNSTFDELVTVVQQRLLDSLPHEVYPFELVRSGMEGIGAAQVFPIFSLVDRLEQSAEIAPLPASIEEFELLRAGAETRTRRIHTSFYVRAVVRAEGISGEILYLKGMYRSDTVARFAELLCRVLRRGGEDRGGTIASILVRESNVDVRAG